METLNNIYIYTFNEPHKFTITGLIYNHQSGGLLGPNEQLTY